MIGRWGLASGLLNQYYVHATHVHCDFATHHASIIIRRVQSGCTVFLRAQAHCTSYICDLYMAKSCTPSLPFSLPLRAFEDTLHRDTFYYERPLQTQARTQGKKADIGKPKSQEGVGKSKPPQSHGPRAVGKAKPHRCGFNWQKVRVSFLMDATREEGTWESSPSPGENHEYPLRKHGHP